MKGGLKSTVPSSKDQRQLQQKYFCLEVCTLFLYVASKVASFPVQIFYINLNFTLSDMYKYLVEKKKCLSER